MARFRPGVVPTAGVIVAVAALASLGAWQVQRLAWRNADIAAKNALIDRAPVPWEEVLADPAAQAWRRTTVAGTLDSSQSIVVYPVTFDLVDGGRILTPLRVDGIDGADAVLVDRGFVPGAQLEAVRVADHPEGRVVMTGVVKPLALSGAAPGSATSRREHWIRFDPAKPAQLAPLEAQLPYRLAPVLIQAEDDGSGAPLHGALERPVSPVDHKSYAITWFLAAAAVLATWLEYGFREGRRGGAALTAGASLTGPDDRVA